MIDISPTADALGVLLAPKVRLGVDAIYTDIQAEANRLERFAARQAYPLVVAKVPTGSKLVCHHALTEFGGMSLGDIAAMLVNHAKETGTLAHPSVVQHFRFLQALREQRE